MKPDEIEKRLKNALIYGTSHPEAYMTKADELWEKYAYRSDSPPHVTCPEFLAALHEYGEAVRAEAVKVCYDADKSTHPSDLAAAIKDMELP